MVSADLAHTHLKTGHLTETTAVVDVKFQIDSKWTDWLTHSQDTVSILESSFRKETLANLKWQRQGFRTFSLRDYSILKEWVLSTNKEGCVWCTWIKISYIKN